MKPTPLTIAGLKKRGFKQPKKTLSVIKRGLAESAAGLAAPRKTPDIQWAITNLSKLANECHAKGMHSLAGSLESIQVTLS